jgi:hypothetical protein
MTPRQREIIEGLHQRSHEAEDDPDNVSLLCLTDQEVYLVMLGIILIGVTFNCLEPRVVQLEEKVLESLKEQRPDWFDGGHP